MKTQKLLIVMGLLCVVATSVMAQDDFDDLDAPPPAAAGSNGAPGGFPGGFDSSSAPPPTTTSSPRFGGGSGSGAGARAGRGAGAGDDSKGGTGGVLSTKQKEKISKAGLEEITNENFPEIIESFDFPKASVNDVAKAISELTGKNFIIDPGVRGDISIIAPSKITVAEAYKAFLSALSINGMAVVPSGAFYKIRQARVSLRDGIDTYSGKYFPNSDQLITRIFHLNHISADLVNQQLKILASPNGEIMPYVPTNSLIISDYGANIERVARILEQLDVEGFDDQMEVVPIKFAKAKDIAELINKIVNKGDTQNRNGGFSAGVPRFGVQTSSRGGQGSAYFTVIPDDRTNSLIVSGNKSGLDRVRKLLTQLDFKIQADDAGGIYVYYLKNGDAEKVATTLQAITKDSTPKPAASSSGSPQIPNINPVTGVQPVQTEIFGGEVKISADKNTNSIVIVASKQDYDVILRILQKLDIPRDQVYVEAVIMELKNTDAAGWNIGYFKFLDESGAKVGFNGFTSTGTTLSSLLDPSQGAGAILGFGSGDKMQIQSPTMTAPLTIPSLLGFVNFLKANTNANVLSSPHILALDNQEAEIKVGDRIATSFRTTGTATAGVAPVTEPVFEDAEIALKIKPFISPSSNKVRMELANSVKQLTTVTLPPALQSSTQPLATRSIKTNIVLPDGDTAVLGGLMKESEIESVKKIPLLGDIPVLGWLFKGRDVQKEKTNLVVFITPNIIRNQADASRIATKKLGERTDFVKRSGGRDPFGEAAEEIRKKNAVGRSTAPSMDDIKLE